MSRQDRRELRRSFLPALLLGAAAVLSLQGCMSFNPRSLRAMDQALVDSNPGIELRTSMSFGVGALTLDFIDFAFIHDRKLDISKISHADIGIYEFSGMASLDEFRMPAYTDGGRHCPRRDLIMRIREYDEYVQVHACIRDEEVTGLEMQVLEPGELVVVNARGNFQSLVATLIRGNMGRRKDETVQPPDTTRPGEVDPAPIAESGEPAVPRTLAGR